MQNPPGVPDPNKQAAAEQEMSPNLKAKPSIQRQPAAAPGTPPDIKVDKVKVKNFFADYLETSKTVCTAPNFFFEHMPREGGFQGPTIFLCVGAGVSAVLHGVLSANIVTAMGEFVCTVLLFLGMARGLEYVLKQFGGKGSFEETYRVLCYSSPPLLLTWLPVVGPFAYLYVAILWFIGLKKVHDIIL